MNPALLASLAALAVGPLLLERTRGRWALAGLDAFALVAVGGLVSAHILPQCFARAGWVAAPMILLGLFGPGLLCGSHRFTGRAGSRLTLPLALLGIALHALLDGVWLQASSRSSGAVDALALAIVLHRVSDGLGIWWLARPAYGRRVALFLLGTLALFSVLGFAFAGRIEAGVSHSWFGLLQALIAGSLLHVILGHPPTAGERPRAAASWIGGLLGLTLVLVLESFVRADEHAGGGSSLYLPLVLLALFVAALLRQGTRRLVDLGHDHAHDGEDAHHGHAHGEAPGDATHRP